MSFTQCSSTRGRMSLHALSLWPGRQPYRHRLVGGRRRGGPSSVAPRSRNPPNGRRRDSPISSSVFARPTHVRSQLSARQQSPSSPDPAGKDSATSSPMLTEAGTSVRLSFQSSSLLLLAGRRVEWRDCAHEALPRLQSASCWSVMEQLVSGVCCLSCEFHAAGNSSPDVRRGDTGQ